MGLLGRLDRSVAAAAHVTPENLELFIEAVRSGWGSVILAMTVSKVGEMARYLNPADRLEWLRPIEAHFKRVAQPMRHAENVTSDMILRAGKKYFKNAVKSTHLPPLIRARLARNGLMVALLAAKPMRHKNFSDLRLEASFRRIENRWWIVLEGTDTKNKRVDEGEIPEYLEPLLRRYLEEFRPILLAAGREDATTTTIEMLWIAQTGALLSYSAVACAIRDTTFETLGVRLTPHAFRRAAKATEPFLPACNPGILAGVLHHTHSSVSDRYYDRSNCRRAALELGTIVDGLIRKRV
ncbi:MAG: hypothetical protein ABW003_05155 [Microvirga sp.]